MLSFRFLAVVVTTSLTFGIIRAQADDTPAQAAARAALEQQMNQEETEQPPGSTNTPPMTPIAPPATTATPPVVSQTPAITQPTPQFTTNVPVTPEMETEVAPSTLSLTNQPATAEMNTRKSVANMTIPPPSVLNTNETAQYPVNPPMAPLPPPQSETTAPPSEPINTMQASQPGGANVTAGNIGNEPHPTNTAPNFDNMTAPPLPISAEKQAELQNLLSQYMANQLTPEQYHEQRAKIMAEP
ncbi:MAG TPA: hypothetical protein VGY98_15100 [Verrucomicrobiae bacterium]|nr:hypothetical protein [Verrucomicrobiae bacterium]